jgi:hypothetical protein
MTRRLLYIAMGATAGVLIVRKLTETAQRFTPAGVQSSLGARFAAFREDLRDGMAEREAELRTELGLDGSHDLVDS